jgi:hypothetical protein
LAGGTTSRPTPSPGIAAIVNVFIGLKTILALRGLFILEEYGARL